MGVNTRFNYIGAKLIIFEISHNAYAYEIIYE